MGGLGPYRAQRYFFRLLGLGAICLVLANCTNGSISSRTASNSVTTDAEAAQERQTLVREAQPASTRYVPAPSNGHPIVVGARPTGCPHAFCGCEASLYLFGQIHPDLNLASNWLKKFPRSSPGPGAVAVRNHHVFVLMSHVSGSEWLVHDGNSGRGLIREHVRSISGYAVVNPHAADLSPARLAQAER